MIAGLWTGQTCRTCHEIHTTYTGDDWALTTTDPVTFYAVDGTYDGGKGNLCANCHQPRRSLTGYPPTDGMIEVDSTHWGPHYGTEAALLVGNGDVVTGSPSPHVTMVADTCVSCHVGAGNNHTFEPSVAACTGCHADAEDFDINGTQTEIKGLMEELAEHLETDGLLHDGHPADGTFEDAKATALWIYRWIYSDRSNGVHNPALTRALLAEALSAWE